MRASSTSRVQKIEVAVGEGASRLIEDALCETLNLLGFDIVLAEWAGSRGGHGRILRIYLDHLDPANDEGITLGACTKMSRVIGDALDAAEADPKRRSLAALLGAPYTLEVSSPGIERPLVKRSHFARFLGRRAVVKTNRALLPESNQRTFTGVLFAAEEDPDYPGDDHQGIVGLRDPESGAEQRLSLAVIRRANLVYEGC